MERNRSSYEMLKHFLPPDLVEEILHNESVLDVAIRHKDLARVDLCIREIGTVFRRVQVPRDILFQYGQNLIERLERSMRRGGFPLELFHDFRRIVEREIDESVETIGILQRKDSELNKKANIENEIKQIQEITISEEQPILFFLGAGASKPKPSSIPTVSEMLKELWKKSNRMENRPLAKLEQWCKENNIENIEEMLTGVTLSDLLIKNRKVHNLLNSVLYPEFASLKELTIRDIDSVSSFQSTIDTFFSLMVGTMLYAQPNALHEAIANFSSLFGCAYIVTTNYDACMDQALDNSKVEHSYIIGSQKKEGMPLVKMHGSINWFYCPSCQNVLIPTIENMRQSIKNNVPYSVTGICPICTGPTKQFIVPPTSYKFLIYPPIVQVWNAGRDIFEKSKVYVIIGYSFSTGDDYITKMLLKAIREDPSKQLIIIDKSADTIEKFREYLKMHIVSFHDKNFHAFVDSAEIMGPKVIDALMKNGKKAVKSGKKS